jgi:hypothetical protein
MVGIMSQAWDTIRGWWDFIHSARRHSLIHRLPKFRPRFLAIFDIPKDFEGAHNSPTNFAHLRLAWTCLVTACAQREHRTARRLW